MGHTLNRLRDKNKFRWFIWDWFPICLNCSSVFIESCGFGASSLCDSVWCTPVVLFFLRMPLFMEKTRRRRHSWRQRITGISAFRRSSVPRLQHFWEFPKDSEWVIFMVSCLWLLIVLFCFCIFVCSLCGVVVFLF